MRKIIFVITILFLLFNAKSVAADVRVVSTSAELTNKNYDYGVDFREKKLKEFFEEYNSPLSDYSSFFIFWADIYELDWRLIPAISGVESGFGKKIPKNSYNAYGWANGAYRFRSWEESIEIVARALREKYYDRGYDSINKIARIYAPPSKSWSWKVKFFMNEIDSVPIEFSL